MVYITGDTHRNFDAIEEFCDENETTKDIKTVTVPEGISYIAESAFEGSLYITVLEKVILPDSLIVIDINAFGRNKVLSDISFGNGLREIRTFAFAGCKGLKNIILPDNLKTVEKGAFFGCKGLENGGVSFRGKTYKLDVKGDYCDMTEEFYTAVNEGNNDL
ncbi:MAG: leucine-rich repeat domain-containing protein [Oscillospiraceae bacterium]|nr:leucine-rich repeat domain-containing protein [Oscillospiraceae bacterium]